MSKQAALNVAETVIDEAVETVEALERIPTLALNGTTHKQQVVILTAVAAGSAIVSGVATAFVTKKRVQAQYEQILTEQLAEAERHYTVLGTKPDLQEVAAKVDEVEAEDDEKSEYASRVASYQGVGPSVVEAEDGTLMHTQVQNVWETQGTIGQWDQDQEESKRASDPTRPHVISKAEYDEGDLDYTQDSLTWYAGDNTLAELDDSAVPTHMIASMVGEDNLLRFGHGSENEHIVYVRNPIREIDYEITRSLGLYSQEVAAFDVDEREEELQLAARMRRR